MSITSSILHLAQPHFPATSLAKVIDTRARFECYLFKKSRFYTKIRFSSKKWQLRWFILDEMGFRYCREKGMYDTLRIINIFSASTVSVWDEDRNIFKLVCPEQTYYLQAPSHTILEEIVHRLQHALLEYSQLSQEEKDERFQRSLEMAAETAEEVGEEDFENILEAPSKELSIALLFHYFLYPYKLLFYYTIPDARLPSKKSQYGAAIFICICWLAALSYVMIFCAENLGKWLNISSSTMGLTVSAVGTSFPTCSPPCWSPSKGWVI
jgi:hypothetical protein